MKLLRLAVSMLLILLPAAPALAAPQCVVLLHGLMLKPWFMEKMAEAARQQGYVAVNVGYPSRQHTVQELAPLAVEDGLEQCRAAQASPVSFVTHSMGGILLRQYLENHSIGDLHRVVMLGPPNQGSEVVDRLEGVPGFDFVAGPAGGQLGTGEDDLPHSLGPVDFELGVIAGTSSINPLFSFFVPNPDDGTVAVQSTRVEGMCAQLVLPVTHFWMMRNDEVIDQTLTFLEQGEFTHPQAENGLCGRA